jgi:hypothetical protein
MTKESFLEEVNNKLKSLNPIEKMQLISGISVSAAKILYKLFPDVSFVQELYKQKGGK